MINYGRIKSEVTFEKVTEDTYELKVLNDSNLIFNADIGFDTEDETFSASNIEALRQSIRNDLFLLQSLEVEKMYDIISINLCETPCVVNDEVKTEVNFDWRNYLNPLDRNPPKQYMRAEELPD